MALPMRRFTLITVIVLFALLVAASIYQFVLVAGKPRTAAGPGVPAIRVPDVVGLTRDQAASLIEGRGLRYRVEPAEPPIDDTVVAQQPADGFLARAAVVTLDVRCVPKPCPLPPAGQEIYDPCSCAAR